MEIYCCQVNGIDNSQAVFQSKTFRLNKQQRTWSQIDMVLRNRVKRVLYHNVTI